MLYFIPWVVFLLIVVLAVPVASYLEKRKYAAAHPTPTPESDEHSEAVDEAEMPVEEFADDGFGGEGGAEFAEVETPGGDDFSAFDEEFK